MRLIVPKHSLQWLPPIAGWVLVVPLLASDLTIAGAVWTLLCAASTILLLKMPEMPHQRRALKLSSIGPLLALAGTRMADHLVPLLLPGVLWEPKQFALLFVALNGVVEVGVMVWVWRGWGIVAFGALSVQLGFNKEQMVHFLADCPWGAQWVLFPLISIILTIAKLVLITKGLPAN